MVRVPRSSGDSGFHRESNQEDVEIKLEPGIDAPAMSGSPQTQLREGGSTEGQTRRRVLPGRSGGIYEGRPGDEDRQAQADRQRSSWPGDYSADDEQQAGRGEDHVALAEGSGICSKSLRAYELFDLELKTIVRSLQNLFDKLSPLVGTASSSETEKLMTVVVFDDRSSLNVAFRTWSIASPAGPRGILSRMTDSEVSYPISDVTDACADA
ncbi:unnamed protein product [Phytophthora fragariaefolia]|uniref:Unnamed protein product n=1 Tax=Phytophthora fragariaefolia TaxID=1490495 RepID=A0A9W7CTA8_9STRA|nr:unnamed protein product [Phytophthora fragariaefolia]